VAPSSPAQDPGGGPGPAGRDGSQPDIEHKLEALWRAIGKAEGFFSADPNVIRGARTIPAIWSTATSAWEPLGWHCAASAHSTRWTLLSKSF